MRSVSIKIESFLKQSIRNVKKEKKKKKRKKKVSLKYLASVTMMFSGHIDLRLYRVSMGPDKLVVFILNEQNRRGFRNKI